MAYPTNTNSKSKLKQLSIIEVSHITDRQTAITGTLPELLVYFKSVLESGAACTGRGTRRINTNPDNLRSLITMLNKAKRNLTGSRFEPPISYCSKKSCPQDTK